MLARFGFRWILAVTMTLTHLGLIGVVLYRESPGIASLLCRQYKSPPLLQNRRQALW